jgi:hypothetical protein
MSLKISGRLFSGPYPLATTALNKRRPPVVFVIISKEGVPWNPTFRVLDCGDGGEDGIDFAAHPDRPAWESAAEGAVGVYLLEMPRDQASVDDRSAVVAELRQRYSPPHGSVAISGI